ncbi:MAG: transcription antitermination factor NusB [Ruminococcaceae bacterium]|nr:transcription antitermination factor NusB [Oscillospiraceae bacterium]
MENPDSVIYENRNNISRYKKREQAVLLSFEKLFSDTGIDEIADNIIDSRDEYYSDYAVEVAKAIEENLSILDELISSHLSKGWKISRISRISLAVLRVAVYEMKYVDEVPVSVAINEAVELVKKYSVDDASFVNGVLGAIARELN